MTWCFALCRRFASASGGEVLSGLPNGPRGVLWEGVIKGGDLAASARRWSSL